MQPCGAPGLAAFDKMSGAAISQSPQAVDPERSAGQAIKNIRYCAREPKKKPTNSELPAWLHPKAPHLHLATTLPRKAGWRGRWPNS